jgi:uncharacterized DUF497 family protein
VAQNLAFRTTRATAVYSTKFDLLGPSVLGDELQSSQREPCPSLYMMVIYNMLDLTQIEGFEWDEGNNRKSVEKHDVSQAEAEQVFFNDPLLILGDIGHSSRETRLHALGRTDAGRPLHISFTLRGGGNLIRVISARTMHRKERLRYDQEA